MARFALDEGFPDTIFGLADLLPGIELVPLRRADPRLVGNSEDWAVVLRVSQLDYDGFLTTDGRMVEEPKVISVLHQTKSALIAFLETGHDAIRASGLALLHLPHIARAIDPNTAQLWILRPPPYRNPKKAWEQIGELASRHDISAEQLFKTERVTDLQ